MTYDELHDALHRYLKREDPETVANEGTAIELARQMLEKVFFPIESEEMVSPPLAVVDGTALLPDDFGQAVSVGRDLAYVPPRVWQRMVVDAPQQLGASYSIFAGQVHVHASISALSMVYNAKPEIIAGGDENWLSMFYAPVWLHAAVCEQYRFIEDYESAAAADQHWRGMVAEFSGTSERRRQAGGSLRMKSR